MDNLEIKVKRNNLKIQNNHKARNRIKNQLKYKIINRNLKNLNQLRKKILKKIRKEKTSQITIVFKKEVYKKQIRIKILNLINIQIQSQKAQNHYRFILIQKQQINRELKEYLKILKCKKERKILKIISKIF